MGSGAGGCGPDCTGAGRRSRGFRRPGRSTRRRPTGPSRGVDRTGAGPGSDPLRGPGRPVQGRPGLCRRTGRCRGRPGAGVSPGGHDRGSVTGRCPGGQDTPVASGGHLRHRCCRRRRRRPCRCGRRLPRRRGHGPPRNDGERHHHGDRQHHDGPRATVPTGGTRHRRRRTAGAPAVGSDVVGGDDQRRIVEIGDQVGRDDHLDVLGSDLHGPVEYSQSGAGVLRRPEEFPPVRWSLGGQQSLHTRDPVVPLPTHHRCHRRAPDPAVAGPAGQRVSPRDR